MGQASVQEKEDGISGLLLGPGILGHGSIGYHSYHRETFVRHKNSPWLITRPANDPNLTYLIASVNRLSRSGQDYRSIRLSLVSFKSSPTIQNAVEKKASVGRRSIYWILRTSIINHSFSHCHLSGLPGALLNSHLPKRARQRRKTPKKGDKR